MIDYEIIGNRIRQARLKKGFTQEVLAEKLDMSAEYCSKIECGKAKVNLERLSQISVILDTEIEYLISGTVCESKSYLKDDISNSINQLSSSKLKAVKIIIDAIVYL